MTEISGLSSESDSENLSGDDVEWKEKQIDITEKKIINEKLPSKVTENDGKLHILTPLKRKHHKPIIWPISPEEVDISRKFPNYSIPRIDNIVSKSKFDVKIDLNQAVKYLTNAEYSCPNPMILRNRNPSASAMVFSSGTINVVGVSDSEFAALAATRCFARRLFRIGYPIKFNNFSIETLHATGCVHREINLSLLSTSEYANTGNISFNTEKTSFLSYNMIDPNVKIQIYRTGKIKFLGAKNRTILYEAWCTIISIVEHFFLQKSYICPCQKP